MKKFTLTMICIFIVMCSFAQSIDEKVGAMVNNGQWFEFREFYKTNTDSINPFLDLYAKAMLANFFNQHNETVQLCPDLLHNAQIDLGNVTLVGSILCSNLGNLGKNDQAAQTIEAIDSSIKPYYEYLDSVTIAGIKRDIALYKTLSLYKISDVKTFKEKAIIPFRLVSVGPDKRN